MTSIANEPQPEDSLRVDFVITELFVGGAERCLTELAIGLARRGDRVRVASIGSLPGGHQARLVDRLHAAGIEVFSAQCDRPVHSVAARARLRDWLRSDPAPLVQTMLFHANVIGTLAAMVLGTEVRVGGVRVAERLRWRTWIEAWAMRRMHAVVCVSESVRQFVEAECGAKNALHVIGNSVDLEQVDATQAVDWNQLITTPGLFSNQVLLFVGRLHAQKGLDLLFETMPERLRRHPDMQLVIVGDGPLRHWALARANRIDATRIAVIGWRMDAHALIKGCRLLVLPSRYEGMPNVVMEAMAARKPVVATRVEGVNELLREGASDQTCAANDPQALGALIDQLWSDRDRAALIGHRNREIIEAHHSPDAMVQRYRDLYRSLIHRSRE